MISRYFYSKPNMAERPNKFFVAIIVFGVLFTGTVNSIVKKVQFGVTVKGYYNWSDNNIQTPHPFNKAWWQTFLMFVGELLCLFGYLIVTCKKKRQFKTPQGFNEVGWKETIYSNRIISWVFILPVLCDTASTVMQCKNRLLKPNNHSASSYCTPVYRCICLANASWLNHCLRRYPSGDYKLQTLNSFQIK